MTYSKNGNPVCFDDIGGFEREIERVERKRKQRYSFFTTLSVFMIAAALAAVLGAEIFPVMKVEGTSMSPTFKEGDIVLTVKDDIQRGDVITFSSGSKSLVKRVIAIPGDTVNIEDDGTVYVNGEALDEPYVEFLSKGDGDVDYPFNVPEDSFFVLGDNREKSIDSRYSQIGTVSYETVGTKVLMKLWPLKNNDKGEA